MNDKIIFREYDLILSFRYYLLTERIRDNGYGNIVSLPYLYPSMQNDSFENGIRLAELYAEEKMPCYPVIGLSNLNLVDVSRGNGFTNYTYSLFLDALVREEIKGDFDREATFRTLQSLYGDLRTLLTDTQFCKEIPYYIFNENNGSQTLTSGAFDIADNPDPRIISNPTRSYEIPSINCNFEISLYLFD